MPFQSEKQRRYLHANHPQIAKRWEKEYAHGGILDITGEEESTTDDGNDIELTAFNAAFDDPNDLSTGVRTLFMKKGGHAIGGGTIQGEPRGDRTGFRNPHGGGGQYGGGQNTGNQGSDKDHSRFDAGYYGGDTTTTSSTDDGGMGAKEQYIQTQYTSPEAKRARDRRDIKEDIEKREQEKYDTWEQRLQDIPGLTTDNPYKGKFQKTHTQQILEEAERRQKAALNKWGLGQLGKIGVMLAAMVGLYNVPLMDALKAVPKTISLTKEDLATLVKESLPVAKAKKAHIKALEEYKTSLLGQVDTLNPNEMKSKTGTEISNITNEINELTQTRDEDEDTRGGDDPELPPQLGGTSTEEMATEYVEQPDFMGWMRANQERKKAYDEKIERERQAREENPIVTGTETDIIAIGNKGGLANLFRVKNQ
jgi:hypothetical protein